MESYNLNPVESVGSLKLDNNVEGGVQIAFIAGSIREGEQDRMNRMLFRVTRGKALTYFRSYKQDDETRVTYMVVY